MILLDTNVVSEFMRPAPLARVVDWLTDQESAHLHISTVTIAEIVYGLRVLPEGKRRRSLERRFDQFVARGFEHRILSFDEPAARLYAEVMARRKELGQPIDVLDGQIASIALANRLDVATRNVRDFEECGLRILNPFVETAH